jgi:hypothetical protein
MKYILILWICSSIPGNECKIYPTSEYLFNDLYDCTIYGYDFSHKLVLNFDRKFVNEYAAYTKFMCEVDKKTST